MKAFDSRFQNAALRLTISASVSAALHLSASTVYVSLESKNPVAPYASWQTAANDIQHAVNFAKAGDTVLLTNGVYSPISVPISINVESVNGPLLTAIDGGGNQRCVRLASNAVLSGLTLSNGVSVLGGGVLCDSGGVVTNCILTSNKAISSEFALGGGANGGTLYSCVLTGNSAESPNGSGGGGAFGSTLYDCTIRGNFDAGALNCVLYNCVVVSNAVAGVIDSILYNCRIDHNAGWFEGGGAQYSILFNCRLTGNGAVSSGGGAAHSRLYNCTLVANHCSEGGGGAFESELYSCTLVGNSASVGGGAFGSTLQNCIVHANSNGNYTESYLSFCMTTPLPAEGVGNITGSPSFIDETAGDFRLQMGSPCIDAGTNLVDLAFVNENKGTPLTCEPVDVLGNTRFIDGNGDGIVTWDIGAYEFNSFKPPRFVRSPQRLTDGWKLTVTGEPNKWTKVQRSEDLKNWGDFWTGFMPPEGLTQITDYETKPFMFYRAVVP